MNLKGKIIKGIAGFYYIDAEDKIYECKAKGIFRNRKQKPLVGDIVDIEVLDNEKRLGNILKIHKRKNSLIRPEVSNIDQAVIIFAIKNPDPNIGLLDRFIISMDEKDIPVTIIFNKKDLLLSDEKALAKGMRLIEIYEKAGYNCLLISAREEESREKVREILRNKTSVLSGPSGVGKSTLTNLLYPDARMETGELSRKIERGKNTTRHAELFTIEKDSYILDTPGFSSLFLPAINSGSLIYYFPEFEEYRNECRFNNCLHINERDCAVKAALEDGKISRERYESYISIYNELKDSEDNKY